MFSKLNVIKFSMLSLAAASSSGKSKGSNKIRNKRWGKYQHEVNYQGRGIYYEARLDKEYNGNIPEQDHVKIKVRNVCVGKCGVSVTVPRKHLRERVEFLHNTNKLPGKKAYPEPNKVFDDTDIPVYTRVRTRMFDRTMFRKATEDSMAEAGGTEGWYKLRRKSQDDADKLLEKHLQKLKKQGHEPTGRISKKQIFEGVIYRRLMSKKDGSVNYMIRFHSGIGTEKKHKFYQVPSSWVISRQEEPCRIPVGTHVVWGTGVIVNLCEANPNGDEKLSEGIVVDTSKNGHYCIVKEENGLYQRIMRDAIVDIKFPSYHHGEELLEYEAYEAILKKEKAFKSEHWEKAKEELKRRWSDFVYQVDYNGLGIRWPVRVLLTEDGKNIWFSDDGKVRVVYWHTYLDKRFHAEVPHENLFDMKKEWNMDIDKRTIPAYTMVTFNDKTEPSGFCNGIIQERKIEQGDIVSYEVLSVPKYGAWKIKTIKSELIQEIQGPYRIKTNMPVSWTDSKGEVRDGFAVWPMGRSMDERRDNKDPYCVYEWDKDSKTAEYISPIPRDSMIVNYQKLLQYSELEILKRQRRDENVGMDVQTMAEDPEDGEALDEDFDEKREHPSQIETETDIIAEAAWNTKIDGPRTPYLTRDDSLTSRTSTGTAKKYSGCDKWGAFAEELDDVMEGLYKTVHDDDEKSSGLPTVVEESYSPEDNSSRTPTPIEALFKEATSDSSSPSPKDTLSDGGETDKDTMSSISQKSSLSENGGSCSEEANSPDDVVVVVKESETNEAADTDPIDWRTVQNGAMRRSSTFRNGVRELSTEAPVKHRDVLEPIPENVPCCESPSASHLGETPTGSWADTTSSSSCSESDYFR